MVAIPRSAALVATRATPPAAAQLGSAQVSSPGSCVIREGQSSLGKRTATKAKGQHRPILATENSHTSEGTGSVIKNVQKFYVLLVTGGRQISSQHAGRSL